MTTARATARAFIIGLIAGYLVFVIRPAILNQKHAANVNLAAVPAINPIGVDLRQMMSYTNSWAVKHQTPYVGLNLYPPLATVLFTPLLLVRFTTAYGLMTVLNLLAAAFLFWWLPKQWITKKAVRQIWGLIALISLVSYGFMFEIERGQFNLLATAFTLAGVYLFQNTNRRWRTVAYILFSLGVQLKVYPFIFVLLLVKDWSDWRDNIRRWLGLAVANGAALLILGGGIFKGFLRAIGEQSAHPFIWIGNHSIKSFVVNAGQNPDFIWFSRFFVDHSVGATLTLFGLLGFSVVASLWLSIRRSRTGLDPYLFTNLTAAALLIPSVSHDYKLPLLTLPLILTLNATSQIKLDGRRHLWRKIIVSLIAFVFVSLSVSYTMKDPTSASILGALFENNLLGILILAGLATALSNIDKSSTTT